VHSLIQSSVDELQSFHPEDCVTCYQLRRGLKEATMYALLCSTWMHLHSEVTAQNQVRTAEINLTYALKDFREHQKIWHTAHQIVTPWTSLARNAS